MERAYLPDNPVLRWGLFLVAGIGAGLVLLYGLLQTPWAKAQIETRLEQALSSDGERAVAISRIGGRGLGHVMIDEITVSDRDGPWLTISDTDMRWHPLKLLLGQAHVSSLRIGAIAAQRPPATGDAPKDGQGFQIPDLPVAVSVDEIAASRLRLDAMIPQSLEDLRLSGGLQWKASEIALEVDMASIESDQIRLESALSYSPASRKTSVRIEGRERAGGLIAGLLGLQEASPLTADMDIRGRFPALSGEMTLAAGATRIVDLRLRPDQADGPGSRITGAVSWPGLGLRADQAVGIETVLAEPKNGVFEIRNGRIQDGSLVAGVEGNYDRKRSRIELSYTIKGASGPVLEHVTSLSFAQADGGGEVAGPVAAPEIRTRLEFRNVARDGLSVETLLLSGQGEMTRRGDDGGLLLGVVGTDFRWDTGEGGGIHIKDLDWQGRLRRSRDGDRIDLVSSEMTTSVGSLSARGFVQRAGRDDQAMSLMVEGKMVASPFAQADYGAFFETPVLLTASVKQSGGQPHADVETVRLDHKLFRVNAGGRIGLGNPSVALKCNLQIIDLTALGRQLALGVAGDELLLDADISGTRNDPSAEFTVSSPRLVYNDRVLTDVAGNGHIRDALTDPKGALELRADTERQPLRLEARIGKDPSDEGRFATQLNLSAPETKAHADLVWSRERFPVRGTIQARFQDLEAWSWIAGYPLGGSLDMDASLRSEGGGPSRLVASVTGANIRAGSAVSVSLLQARSDGPFSRDSMLQSVDVRLSEGRFSRFTISDLKVSGTAGPDEMDLAIAAGGRQPQPFQLDAALSMRKPDQARRVVLDRFRLESPEDRWVLQQPARLRIGPDGVDVGRLDIAGSQGAKLGIEGFSRHGEIQADLDLARFPLTVVSLIDPRYLVAGTISGTAKLTTRGEQASGKADLTIDALRPKRFAAEQSVDGRVRMALANDRLTSRIEISQRDTGSATANFAMHLGYSQAEGFSVASGSPVSAQIRGRADVTPLWPIFGPENQSLAGVVRADIGVSGTLDDPVVRGDVVMEDGQYQHLVLGILLDEVKLDGSVNNRRVILKDLSATDGGAGSYRVEGFVDFDPALGMPANVRATVDNAILVQRSDVMARASGQVVYTSEEGNKLVKGDIESHQIDIQIPEQLPVNVVELDVVEVGGARTSQQTPPSLDESAGAPTRLDITVSIPKRTYVRGRGLDSQWNGDLHIGGTLSSPEIDGGLNLLQGSISLLGERFTLTEGQIDFFGTSAINPRLNVAAEHEKNNITTIVSIGGRAQDPEITLSSRPPLPENEVLSQLLFGQSSASLSALEALQLASSLRTLSGRGSGVGLMGRARDALGLDVLSVESGEGGAGPQIRGGKYLSDRVYLEVDKGATAADDSVGVEIDITDSLSLETDLSAGSGTNLGLKWERDY